jgi:signal transduction histidine kinase
MAKDTSQPPFAVVRGQSRPIFALFQLQILLAGVLMFCLLGWLWVEHEAEVKKRASNIEGTATAVQEQVVAVAHALIPSLAAVVRLAESAEFATALGMAEDGFLAADLSDADAVRLANINQVPTVLASPDGPEAPFSTSRGANRPDVVPWQITRGLPLRWFGRTLARERRRLAENLMAVDSTVHAVTELRSDGTVIFLHPYSIQLQRSTWQMLAPPVAAFEGPTAIVGTPRLVHGLPLDDALAVLAKIPDHSAGNILGLIIDRAAVGLPVGPFALFDANGGNAIIRSSSQGDESAWASTGLNLVGKSYVLRVPLHPIGNESIFLIPTAAAVILLAGFLVAVRNQFGTAMNIRDSLSRRLADSRTAIEGRAQRIAHDLRNVALNLKTLNNNIRAKLNVKEMQNFDGLLIDLDGYTQYLSTRLAAEGLGFSDEQIVKAKTYLRGAVDTVASQVETPSNRRLRVAFDDSLGSQEPFVELPGDDLSRILQNILRNATEACESIPDATITVSARREGNRIAVVVKDSGCGIPLDIQSRIFDDGVSTKSDNGRGKGLPSARERARKHSGEVRLLWSEEGKGTAMELELPLADTPQWFTNTLRLSNTSVIVVIDDESSGFEYWEKAINDRFASLNIVGGSRPQLHHLKSPVELEYRVDLLESATHFLVDYHFEGSTETGLDVIAKLDIGARSTLVTNLFETQAVLDEAIGLNVGVMPKPHVLNARLHIDLEGQ